uniref:cell division protein ZapA n=1 Tax=Pararhizobium sp. IMCC3301 TaxID=3067904 RepID=UPI0027406B11|nr:cell division protein ZapA [Pararhizobium sp. IMCC3301]
MAQITVNINGRSYRMACEDGQESHLQLLAEQFDTMVKQLRSSFGEIGDQRLTVMAGVMGQDEVFELRNRVMALEKELENLRATRDQANDRVQRSETQMVTQMDEASKLINEMAERLEGM